MLHAGLDLSRRRLDVCLISGEGEVVGEFAVSPDADGLRGLARRLGPVEVRCVIESMTGARFVHDTLEQLGWDVLIADAQKVKGHSGGPLRSWERRAAADRAVLIPGRAEAQAAQAQARAQACSARPR